MLRQSEARIKQLSPARREKLRPMVRRLTERLARGEVVRVDLDTGVLIGYQWGSLTVRISGLRWLKTVDEKKPFDVSRWKWQDRTNGPLKGGDPNDLAMIGHCGAWRPGAKGYELDGRLINVKTGQFWRIPFQGSVSLPGCFLKPRTRVVVSGMDPETGSLGLFEVDLATGANRHLGGKLLSTGACLGPALSPDGKTLAVGHKEFGGSSIQEVLQLQVCLVDLTTGEARKLGRPMDTAFLSWLPDGKGMILVSRKHIDMDTPAKETICRMDLTGKVTPIVPGGHPVLLAGGLILFRGEDDLWRTCDLIGKNVKLFAGGMKGCGFPSPGPDGKRIFWMRVQPPRAPRPVVMRIGSRQLRSVTAVGGLWASPAWR